MATHQDTKKYERSPVVVVMGHIDHGKSTLLDYIRKSNVVSTEAGGITQHISAYEIEHEREGSTKRITFIDTPGHEAFRAMRSHGASIGDIAVLVVAADDGVNVQTMEAHEAIKQAGIPYVVAINKIDKPDADVNRTITSLIENEIYLEGYGGDIPYASISAKTGENVEELLDVILLVAELEEFSTDPTKPAEGVVLESNIDPKAGIAATLIIKNGALSSGQAVQSGRSFAPVRILRDFQGKSIKNATASSPVELVGFNSAPEVGARFHTFSNKKEAQHAAEAFEEAKKESLSSPEQPNRILVPLIIKVDTAGSYDAVLHEIGKKETERAGVRVIQWGIGSIGENDVRTAATRHGSIIVGFNVGTDPSAKDLAERQGVEVNTFSIIYDLATWIETKLKERTPIQQIQKMTGKAKILKTFNRVKNKQVVGGRAVEGELNVKDRIKVIRRDEVICEGTIEGLQQQKVETQKVTEGSEFGGMVSAKMDIAPGDILEAFTVVEE